MRSVVYVSELDLPVWLEIRRKEDKTQNFLQLFVELLWGGKEGVEFLVYREQSWQKLGSVQIITQQLLPTLKHVAAFFPAHPQFLIMAVVLQETIFSDLPTDMLI